MPVVGFDIGSESSFSAVVKSGGIEILDNECNLRSTPTYVAFTETSREIGVFAKVKLVTFLDNTVFGFKKILGKKCDDPDLEKELAYLPYDIHKLMSGDIGVKVNYLKNEVNFSLEQIMAMVLSKLKMISEIKLNSNIHDCVLSIPIYYTDAQRRAMLDAANIAGLNPLKLISEPTAVALSYGFFKEHLSEDNPLNVVFVDFGSSCLTVSIFAFLKDIVKMIGCVWDDVGGRDFDNKLVQYFVDDFKVRYQLDPKINKKALMRLMLECEMLKKVMSSSPLEVKLQIECFMQDKDVYGVMKRDLFEELSADILDRIKRVFHRILEETRLSTGNIHSVEIVGGSSRVPAVKRLICEIFGREPSSTLNQDEAVARGCALQCALLSPLLRTRFLTVEEMPTYVIKILWKNAEGQNDELDVFSFSDKIPAFKIVTFSMTKPFSFEAHYVDIYSRLQKIGIFTFENVPEDADFNGVMRVKVKACLNVHGIFSIAFAKMILKKGKEQNDQNEAKILKDEVKTEIENENVNEEVKKSTDEVAQDGNSGFIVKLSKELSLKSDIAGLSREKLKEFIIAEQKMISQDITEKEKADARNDLEEYIYDARGKLNHELEEFVLENERSELLQYLNEAENRLYDSENLEISEYSNRLKEIKGRVEPIQKRQKEFQERTAVIDEFTKAVQKASECVSYITGISHTSEMSVNILSDIENLRNLWQNKKKYLDQSIDIFSKLEKYDNIPITAADLRESLIKFETEFQYCYSELKGKIESIERTSKSADGDGITGSSKPVVEDNESVMDENTKSELELKQQDSLSN